MEGGSKPIKRSEELVSLSRDHHDGLLLSWKIRTGINKGIELKRIADYVLHSYRTELAEHFRQEEDLIFSLLEPLDEYRLRAENEHGTLRAQINELQQATESTELLAAFATSLNDHIRFEERVLFPHIEEKADKVELQKAGKIVNQLHERKENASWSDEFWLKGII